MNSLEQRRLIGDPFGVVIRIDDILSVVLRMSDEVTIEDLPEPLGPAITSNL